MVTTDFRDTSTLGPVLPDCRTKILLPVQDFGRIKQVVSTDRFVCLLCEGGISIFTSDTPPTAIVDTAAFVQSKKGSTPLTQTVSSRPWVSYDFKGCESVSMSSCNRFMFLFTVDGISFLDLASERPEITSLLKCKLAQGISVQGLKECGVLLWTEKSNLRKLNSVEFRVNNDGISLGDKAMFDVEKSSGKVGDISFGFAEGSLGVVFGEKVYMYNLKSDGVSFSEPVSGSGISPQNGEVISVIPLSGPRVIPNIGSCSGGLLIVQRDVMTVFADDDTGKLDLVFQFRDSISKHEYLSASVDTVKPWLVCVTTEAFNNRVHLELFDLSLLRVKSVSLAPLMRFDVSRLFNRKEGEMIVAFIKTMSGMPSFVQSVVDDTTGHRVGIVWESILRDQWYSFMPNFKVLNKNFPYAESEEEFDFNQNADIDSVCSTINRYKKASRRMFDFVPSKGKPQVSSGATAGDVEMEDSTALGEDPEVFMPFLAPLESWRKKSVEKLENQETGKHVEFFSARCGEILASVVQRSG